MTKNQLLSNIQSYTGQDRAVYILSQALINNEKIQSVTDISKTLNITISQETTIIEHMDEYTEFDIPCGDGTSIRFSQNDVI